MFFIFKRPKKKRQNKECWKKRKKFDAKRCKWRNTAAAQNQAPAAAVTTRAVSLKVAAAVFRAAHIRARRTTTRLVFTTHLRQAIPQGKQQPTLKETNDLTTNTSNTYKNSLSSSNAASSKPNRAMKLGSNKDNLPAFIEQQSKQSVPDSSAQQSKQLQSGSAVLNTEG